MKNRLEIKLPEGYTWNVAIGGGIEIVKETVGANPVKLDYISNEDRSNFLKSNMTRITYHSLTEKGWHYLATMTNRDTRVLFNGEILDIPYSVKCLSVKWFGDEFQGIFMAKSEDKFFAKKGISKDGKDWIFSDYNLYQKVSDVGFMDSHRIFIKEPHVKEGQYYRRNWLRNGTDRVSGLRSLITQPFGFKFWDTYTMATQSFVRKGKLLIVGLASILKVTETAHDGWTHYGNIDIVPMLSTNGVQYHLVDKLESLVGTHEDETKPHMNLIGSVCKRGDTTAVSYSQSNYGHATFDPAKGHRSVLREVFYDTEVWEDYWWRTAEQLGLHQ